MKPTFLFAIICLPSLLVSPLSLAAEKHVHGEANLFIAINQQQVLIELESPAANITGFEYAPKTHEQQQILQTAIAQLQEHTNIVRLNGDSSCTVNTTNIQQPFKENLDTDHPEHKTHHHGEDHDRHHSNSEQHDAHKHHQEHDHHKEHTHADHNEESHTEFHASYELTCSQPALITGATITGLTTFSGIQKMTVHWIKEDKQGAAETTASQNQVGF